PRVWLEGMHWLLPSRQNTPGPSLPPPSPLRIPHSFDSRQSVFPDLIEEQSGLHVAQTIFRDVPKTALGKQRVDVAAGDPLTLRGFDAEGLAIKIEIEPARRAVPSADAIEGQLLRQV